MADSAEPRNWHDVFFTSRDGLRLCARYYPAPASNRRPALCLAGLTRNSRDFHLLASFLSDARNPEARSVLALDARGRGRSEWDPNWRNYDLGVELADALDLLTIAGMSDVAVIGTSRGGLLAMMMACLRPTAMGAVVLNDIGPVIDREGLVHMSAYVGHMPLPSNWTEAAALVRDLCARKFPAIPDEHWPEIARQWFNEEQGLPTPGYDPAIGKTLSLIEGPLPTLWPQFQALTRVPVMAIRGEHSDLMSEQTLAEMRLKDPSLVALTVRGQGHAPMLRDRATHFAISEFLSRADNRGRAPKPSRDLTRLTA
ncbi:MAG: alpha/beta hydrolase [Proteobacteria bacterium]|nr:alpha/beta hydrolase [Pseudomonadota bacterium]